MAEASKAFRQIYRRQQRALATKINNGEAVVVPGTDAVMPKDQYDEFVADLQMQGLAIADGKTDKPVVDEFYVPGSTTHRVRICQLG